MDALTSMITNIANASRSLDEAGRKLLIDQLYKLTRQLESPYDSMQRIMFTNMQLPLLRVGIDTKLFELLAKSTDGLSTEQISASTLAGQDLVARLCRYYAATGMIDEVGPQRWKANAITHTLTNPGWQGGINHYFEGLGPFWQIVPNWLQERGYPNIVDHMDTPLQAAWKTDKPAFVWMVEHPKFLQYFLGYMTVQRESQPSCFDIYPLKQRTEGLAVDQPFFVDVGGNAGHQANAVRQIVPDLTNEVIVEDLEGQLAIAPEYVGVKKVPQDFFQPQAVKGARIYYFRNILHDWPDDKCVEILQNTKAALTDGVVVIDEMVLPETNASWQAAQFDLTMMLGLAARERTIDQWKSVITKAGLQIRQIYTYTTSLGDSLIECVPA